MKYLKYCEVICLIELSFVAGVELNIGKWWIMMSKADKEECLHHGGRL